jgi:hypothetical protein
MQKLFTFLLVFSSFLTLAQDIDFEINNANITKKEIQIELAKYPKNVLQAYLEQITVVTSERFCGLTYAFEKRILLNGNCDNASIKEALHHEMSSILLQQYDVYVSKVFDSYYTQFVKLNGEFAYNGNRDLTEINPSSKLANHFYGLKDAQSGFENDFNVVSQYLFKDGDKIINFMLSNPDKPVSKKIKVVLDFYYQLDKTFSVSYFKNQQL